MLCAGSCFDSSFVEKMKLENEPVLSHSSPPRKSCIPFDSDVDLLDGPSSKEGKKLAKDSPIGFGLEAFDQSVATLPFHMNNGDFQWKDLFAKGMEFYADESVVECEMPEIIVCYKESSYQSVKDICIDEGVPCQGKIWVQTKEEVGKDPSAPVDLSCNIDSELEKGSENSELPILGGLKSSADSNSQLEFANGSAEVYEVTCDRELIEVGSPNQWLANDLPNLGEAVHRSAEGGPIPESCCVVGETEGDGLAAKSNAVAGSVAEKDGLNSNDTGLIPRERLNDGHPVNQGHEVSEKSAADDDMLEIWTSNLESSSTNLPGLDGTEAESTCEERSSHIARPSPSSEPSASADLTDDSATLSKSYLSPITDSRSVNIVANPVGPGKEEEKAPSADEKPPMTQSMWRHAEGTLGNTTYLTLQQHFLGETSLSGGVCPPSSITCLDPIGYTGNISLRSESSTGSTRSFAFPILQPEWHGSPARMRKASQKRSQKLLGWLQTIICCRF